MAYDFFPKQSKEILTKCDKFPPGNVADMIKLHEALTKKYPKVDAISTWVRRIKVKQRSMSLVH